MQRRTWIAAVFGLFLVQAAQAQTPFPVFEVRQETSLATPVKGRLIIVANRQDERFRPAAGGVFSAEDLAKQREGQLRFAQILGVSPSPSLTSSTITTAANVSMTQGESLVMDRSAATFPVGGQFRPGVYFVQAILDVDGDYAYNNKPSPGDLVSDVVAVEMPKARASLALKTVVQPQVHFWDEPLPTKDSRLDVSDLWLAQAKERYELAQETKAHAARVNFSSPLLTAFHGRETPVRAYVLTPPGYAAATERYPTVFRTEGFGATFNGTRTAVEQVWQDMVAGRRPPMIWVFLDHSGPTGTHEFADSANNGPWGRALTEEFIPWLDAHYRTDPAARFTTGHSSGGWAALWLQVRYPKLFAGAWPTAPDPADFHDFTNIDLYAAGANAYRRADGTPTPLMRVYRSKDTVPFSAFAGLEQVLGERGGQLASFDWVFSPRGADGKPKPLFDRDTGMVDPQVAAYWRDNYDIAHIIRRDWTRLKPDLDGKIHLWVGTADTYHLEGSARLLKATLDDLGATSDFHFVEGADHGSLGVGRRPDGTVDFGALERRLAWQMYRQARPNSPSREPQGVATAAR